MTPLARELAAAPPRRILIVRLSAIGDVIMASMVAKGLKRRWPEARLAWLCQPAAAALVAANPFVDEVVTWDRDHWLRLWRARSWRALGAAVRATRQELRRGRYDLVIDLQGLLKSGLLAALAGARRRVGLGSREGSALLMTHRVARGGRPKVVGSEYRGVLEEMGAPLAPGDLETTLHTPADAAAAAALRARHGIGGAYAVLCPFTTRPQKHWPQERWGPLAARLRGTWGLDVVVLGGPGDATAGRAISAAAGTAGVASLAGETSLPQCAALIAGAALVVGVDTGLTHLGMLGPAPTIALFGSTRPYTVAPKAGDRILYRDLPCAPCKRHPTCGGRYECMGELGPDAVLAAAAAILGPAR